MKQATDLDSMIRHLGNFGRYQIFQFALLCLYGCWFTAWQMMGIIFTASTPLVYYCAPPPGFTANETIPRKDVDGDGVAEWEQCKMYAVHDGIVTKNITDCEYGWDYQMTQADETTIATDFDLVCNDGLLSETVQSVFFGGVLAGAVISGQLSDIVGRKIIIHSSLVGEAVFGLALSISWNYYLVLLFMFLVGFFQQGILLTVFVMYMEMFTPEKRGIVGGIGNVMWGIGVALITPIAYLLPNWRHLQLTISLVCLIGIPFYWSFHESVRWLVSRGRLEEADRIIDKIAKFNKISAPQQFLSSPMLYKNLSQSETHDEPCLHVETRDFADENQKSPDDSINNAGTKETTPSTLIEESDTVNGHTATISASTSKKNLLHFLRRPILFRNYVFMCYCWFVNSVVYYGLSLNSVNLAGNKYLNTFLLCVAEIPSSIFLIIALKWLPRRWCQSVSFLIAGIICIVTAAIPDKSDNGTDLGPLIVTAATLGKFSISFSFCLVYVYTSEWLPTIVRNAGMGGTSLCARAAAMVAPFMISLSGVNSSLPPIIFGVLAVIASGLALFFPETRNRTLPTTITDAENLAKESPLCKAVG